jgi:hypothetical protein
LRRRATSSSSPARPRAGPGVRGRVVPFDDREVAREALRRLGAAL